MRFSLGNKVVLLLVAFALVLCGVSVTVSYSVINRMNERSYSRYAEEISGLVARSVDADDLAAVREAVERIYDEVPETMGIGERNADGFDAYAERFETVLDLDEYKTTLARLEKLQEVGDVDRIYTCFVDPADACCVYLVDAAAGTWYSPGATEPLTEFGVASASDVTYSFSAFVDDAAEGGWLVTSGDAVLSDGGEVVCYTFVDVSMQQAIDDLNAYALSLSLVLVSITCTLGVVASLFVNRHVTRPLDALSDAAACYRAGGQDTGPCFACIDIHTGDEIKTLHRSMVAMERDIDAYTKSLTATETKLHNSERRADLMSDLARTDALTGARNRLSFDQRIAALDMALTDDVAFGLAICDLNDLKVINDDYGHDCGDIVLIRLAGILRETFAHSVVYRIGGDEFAVVLVEADYEAAEELLASFEERIEAEARRTDAEPWNRVVAAIGYARYDAALDADAQDVFERADHSMYLKKSAMKGASAVR